VTDRYGGTSAAPYAELNLGGHVGDEPSRVASNRARAADAFGVAADRLVLMSQVHGTAVAVVDGPGTGGPLPEADALVTAAPGLALVVLVADCAPVLLTDTTAGVVAVAHAGRRGMAGGIVAATLVAMRSLGARPVTTGALVGPAICGRCYEVPAELQDEVAAIEPAARSTTRSGSAALDIRAGVVAQLEAAGVASIEVDPTCTAESGHLYSHRRDGVTGRFAGLALLTPAATTA
jgi:YfiH family protein